MYLDNIKLIIWDWNGTLLNDVSICVDAINSLLSDRKRPLIDKNTYQHIFTFPVKDYYQKAGFNFDDEPFEIPAMQFMDIYRAWLMNANLHAESVKVLKKLQSLGFKQAVLSAMEQELLNELLNRYNIKSYFEKTYGIDNHYGTGKIDRGKELIHSMQIDPKTCLLIGDTLHDAEVASALGCQCILFDGGHQSRERLETSGHMVFSKLSELLSY
jgi:phosphoglycolate phosphatase